jgi:hypothetical protein
VKIKSFEAFVELKITEDVTVRSELYLGDAHPKVPMMVPVQQDHRQCHRVFSVLNFNQTKLTWLGRFPVGFLELLPLKTKFEITILTALRRVLKWDFAVGTFDLYTYIVNFSYIHKSRLLLSHVEDGDSSNPQISTDNASFFYLQILTLRII